MRASKRLPVLFVAVTLMLGSPAGYAAETQDVNRVTSWNKVTDWFATIGKSDRDKGNILRRRKAQRRARRTEKAKRQAEKERRERAGQYKSSYISQ
ncbi:MAG: hypothetical protein KC897_02280 [Candidatus Omnitrophica bacterium]|nr:hypothetical protein [Candidatus Omnitrophota bacterium]MCB9721069.1 hypothetical protein [Candidatus Omnitrophota bacterium]